MHMYLISAVTELGVESTFTVYGASAKDAEHAFKYAHPNYTSVYVKGILKSK